MESPNLIGLVLTAGMMTGSHRIGIDSSAERWSNRPAAQNLPTNQRRRQDLIMKLEKAGYTEIREIKSTAEGYWSPRRKKMEGR